MLTTIDLPLNTPCTRQVVFVITFRAGDALQSALIALAVLYDSQTLSFVEIQLEALLASLARGPIGVVSAALGYGQASSDAESAFKEEAVFALPTLLLLYDAIDQAVINQVDLRAKIVSLFVVALLAVATNNVALVILAILDLFFGEALANLSFRSQVVRVLAGLACLDVLVGLAVRDAQGPTNPETGRARQLREHIDNDIDFGLRD